MRKLLLTVFSACLLSIVYCQSNYWQQEVNYTIDVSLDDKEHALNGYEKIEYLNRSPDTLKFIWFHLWPNAYKNDRTAFSDQMLENGNTKFYFSNKEERGYINRLDFKVNNVTAQLEDHPHYIDVIKLILPTPLPPGQKTTITTPFHVKLPYNYSRGGHDGQNYQATQWYPKPAVYDKDGWHPMPYLDQGEFYSEYGSFDVTITVPSNYVVAATGELQNADEKKWLRDKVEAYERDLKVFPAIPTGKKQNVVSTVPASSTELKALRYKQDRIHDFAWFANKEFIVNYDTCRLASGKVIDIFSYYTSKYAALWQNSAKYCRDAIRHYSEYVGEYPYSIAQVVQGPESFGGGMEYPTITVLSPEGDQKGLDHTIAHEVGHNWFYGILGSNERDHPWMDEGINSYYDNKYLVSKYGEQQKPEKILFETKAVTKIDQPIELPSEKFGNVNYDLTAYYKTSEWLRWMETQLGTDTFNKAMQEYYRRWQFKHPQPQDFKKIMEETSGKNLDAEFAYLNKPGLLPNQQRTGTKPVFIFDIKSINQYLKKPSKDLIVISPLIGFNSYDKFMAGGLITNVKLPPSKLEFLLAPLYATGSKRFNGLGFLHYSFYPDGFLRKVQIGVNGSMFTMDRFTDSDSSKTFLAFRKIVPIIRFTFREKNPRSTFHRFIQFKSFMISEDNLSFYQDTVIVGIDTSIFDRHRTYKTDRTLNQLQLVIENNRVLYPYRAELKAEQGEGFIRLGFTGNYFFNYSNNQGGVNVRLFAGKFLYTDRAKANSYRYSLSLSAPKGGQDYAYSDYFIGRNDYPLRVNSVNWTLPYQQIMIRDGALKMNTDIQGNIGSSNDWISAINASFDLPSQINPLSMLPVSIPLKIFVDIGTYAEAWKKNTDVDRFLYDAGFQLSLLANTINIYVPILYSRVYKDYLTSDFINKKKFAKSISFSIDISNFSLRKIDRNLDF